MKQILFDIGRSLKANPPKKTYPKGMGIKWIERIPIEVAKLIMVDAKGVSLQPREKETEDNRTEGEGLTFHLDGVLYDKDVIVVELMPDGSYVLISGFNRVSYFIDMGVIHYFVDVVEFDSPLDRTLWKRRFNSGKDHRAMGVPNTEGTYLKGLLEASRNKEFDPTNDDAVKYNIDFMAAGKKSKAQIEKIFNKFRVTNPKEQNIRGLDIKHANKEAQALGLPTAGYVKNEKLVSYGKCGWVRPDGSILSKIQQMADAYDEHPDTKLELTFYVIHAGHKTIKIKRTRIMEQYESAREWVKEHMNEKYHDMFVVNGFIAQIRDPDPKANGKPLERGLVDVNGNIIIDDDAEPLKDGEVITGDVINGAFVQAARYDSVKDLISSVKKFK